jgi:hypothetical protein
MIKFISYNGKYPSLCFGRIVFEKDGKNFSIDRLLKSGGSCYFTNDYCDEHVESGDWIVDKDALPEELKEDYDYIRFLVNDNITKGCCGGCL